MTVVLYELFYLQHNTETYAQYHVDKHVVKIIVEYAQLLSTVHRVLDSDMLIGHSKIDRKQKQYALPDDREHHLYSATHVNHSKEYAYRCGKVHLCERLMNYLVKTPNNIPKNTGHLHFYSY